MPRLILTLTLLCFINAALVIYMRQISRLSYVGISEQLKLKDELDVEWNKLLTEKSVWTLFRIEKQAKEVLGLKEPSLPEVEYIWVDKDGQVGIQRDSAASDLNGEKR